MGTVNLNKTQVFHFQQIFRIPPAGPGPAPPSQVGGDNHAVGASFRIGAGRFQSSMRRPGDGIDHHQMLSQGYRPEQYRNRHLDSGDNSDGVVTEVGKGGDPVVVGDAQKGVSVLLVGVDEVYGGRAAIIG